MLVSRYSRFIVFLALAASSFGFASCGGTVNCAPGLYEINGRCLDAVSQNFVGCTQDRGQNLSTEDKAKISASVANGVTSGEGVIDVSRKVEETELPDVAIEVVRYCLELSKNVATPAQQLTIQQQIDALQTMLDAQSEGTITLDPDHGPYDQPITVSGTGWPANIELEVASGAARERTTTSGDGSFRTTIKLDPRFESVSPNTVEIRVHPVRASMQLPASALYEIER